MSFPTDFLDTLRNRMRLSDVISARVRLIRRGAEHVGLCPFHKEKSPSFTVSDAKGLYYCFGCGAKGDAIDFVRQTQNITFPEAVQHLAERVGLPVPQISAPHDSVHQALYQLLDRAAGWFQQQLGIGKPGEKAHRYLSERGLTDATLKAFGVGYAPSSPHTTVAGFLRAEGAKTEDLLAAGLLGQSEGDSHRSSSIYERFRDRIIFPIRDARRRVVGFGGRALNQDMPKYLNSADGPLFHKGQLLYGFPEAREAVRRGARPILVEGYLDVMTLHQAGHAGAVAPLGTAVTVPQLELLWALGSEPLIGLDGDAAGERATRRVFDLALPLLTPQTTLRFIQMPQGEDPDSLIRGRHGGRDGPEAWAELEKTSRPFCDALWETAVAEYPIETPEQRATFRGALRGLVAKINDRVLREEYQRDIADRIQAAFERQRLRRAAEPPSGAHFSGVASRKSPGNARPRSSPLSSTRRAGPDLMPRVLLAAILECPELLRETSESFASLSLGSPELTGLQQAIVAFFFSNQDLDKAKLSHHLCNLGFSEALRTLMDEQVLLHGRFARSGMPLDRVLHGWNEVFALVHDQKGLATELREAGDLLKQNFSEQAWQRYRTLAQMALDDQSAASATAERNTAPGTEKGTHPSDETETT